MHVLKEYPSDRLPGYGEIRSLVDKGGSPEEISLFIFTDMR